MNEPLDLAPELVRQKRIEDLELMRKHDKKYSFPVSRYEVKDVLAELNLRLKQYHSQSAYSFDFKILQTVQDFQNLIKPLQVFKAKQRMSERIGKAKVDFKVPVALLDKKMIYVNNNDGFEVFTFTKPE